MKIVLVGGAGNVGREIYEVLKAERRHEVVVFSRKSLPGHSAQGMNVVKVDYTDKDNLTTKLQGVDVVLSFVTAETDVGDMTQRNLIDACVQAGVKRFAPSEWATRSDSGMPMYQGKNRILSYLKQVNRDKQVLEYTLFQPGLFLNYFSYPHKSTDHMMILPMPIDIANHRAIVQREVNARITLTTVQDLAVVVARAIDSNEKWPLVSGMIGTQIFVQDFISLCEKVRGQKFEVEFMDKKDILLGKVNSSWVPFIDHPAVKVEERDAFSRDFLSNFLLASGEGAWDSCDEWNRRLPDMKFKGAEEFLEDIWGVEGR